MQTATPLALTRDLAAALARLLRADIVETHISWVLLTDALAYKIKKPVQFPFVDYSSLQARLRFCEEEVRLNRRLAPSLYLGVSRICGTYRAPALEGPGRALEHAVRMRRFPSAALWSRKIEAGTLRDEDIDALAALLADFHLQAPRAQPSAGFALPQARRGAAMAALEGVRPAATPDEHAGLRTWLTGQADVLESLWNARRETGFVREGHGDLHLDNIVELDTGLAAFDCIEFDPALRWIDTVDDIAFPVMDLCARGRRDLAYRLLNGWLDRTGDHGALPALRFSCVYRALVRCQAERLRGPSRAGQAGRYLETALEWTNPGVPRLCITHGLPGSGKTWQSQRLLEHRGAIRLRSDVERKRLFGLGMLDDSRAQGVDLYGADSTARTYDRLLELARAALGAGYPVILDAAFLLRAERERARALASDMDVAFTILHCHAADSVLRERLRSRTGDASEADAAVLDRLSGVVEPLTSDELGRLEPVDPLPAAPQPGGQR